MGARASKVLHLTLGVALVLGGATAGAQPSQNLADYHLFAMDNLNVKNYSVLTPGRCHTGVNCPHPPNNSTCGVCSHENSFYADNTQIVCDQAQFSKPGANIFDLFTNNNVNPANVNIRGGQFPFTPPILPDLDGDLVPSCALNANQSGCDYDIDDLKVACGFPNPFPACNLGMPVLVLENSDCIPPYGDNNMNGVCDLPPDIYGTLTVQDGGHINFLGGDYAFCQAIYGKNTKTDAQGPTNLDIGGQFAAGELRLGNGSRFGLKDECGRIKVNVSGDVPVNLGKSTNVTMDLCAPDARVRLGHGNMLTGHFVGFDLTADSNNQGFCCGGKLLCACFDKFEPDMVMPGDVLTLTSGCDLTGAQEVRVCGAVCPILTKTSTQITCTVPALAPQVCSIELESQTGVFTHVGTVTIN